MSRGGRYNKGWWEFFFFLSIKNKGQYKCFSCELFLLGKKEDGRSQKQELEMCVDSD